MRCKATRNRDINRERATNWSNVELVKIANMQIDVAHRRPDRSAEQRDYDQLIRREIRRRGLDWKPPERRK